MIIIRYGKLGSTEDKYRVMQKSTTRPTGMTTSNVARRGGPPGRQSRAGGKVEGEILPENFCSKYLRDVTAF